MLPIFIARTGSTFFHDRNTNPACEFANCRRKIDVLVIHHKPENRASDTAPETMKRLSLWAYVKGWRLFLMKWTERFEIRSRAFQWKVGANHLNDVVGGGNLLDGLRRNCSHV